MKALVLSALAALTPTHAQAVVFDEVPTRDRIITMMEEGKSRELTTEALDALFRRAGRLLADQGEKALGDELLGEWSGHYRLVTLGLMGDMGSHAPLNEWLATTYQKIEDALGPTVCDFTHLSDIQVISFTVPVVFNPHTEERWCEEHLDEYPEPTCQREYSRHFAGTKYQRENDPYTEGRPHYGLAPVAAYWVTEGACTAATWGSGFLFCGPISTGVEITIARYVAPKVSDMLWVKFNP